MRLRRFRVERLPSEGGEVSLSTAAAKHAAVLRLAVGDRILLQDEAGHAAEATITELSPKSLRCHAEAAIDLPEPPALVLLLGPPKGSRLDDCVRAAVEVGATAIHLLVTDRTVPSRESLAARLDRLRRIASEAARQSEQAWVTSVEGPSTLREALTRAPRSAARICFDARAEEPVPALPEGEAWIAVGPEGGFSEAEIDTLSRAGFRSARLPTGVLRVETAVPVTLALALAAQERSRRA